MLLAAAGALQASEAPEPRVTDAPSTSRVSAGKATVTGAAVDKRHFHLFHRTPRELLRDLAPDRPDTTESPITVDAGWFQIESSFFDYGRNDDGGIEEEVFTYGAVNFKVGLLRNVDLQLVFDSHVEVRTKDKAANISETVEALSDLQMRLKINLWGNDGGRTALAFFPFIKVPTGSRLSNDNVEGGVILPFSVDLNERFSIGLMAEADFVYGEESRGYETEFVHTAVLGIGVTEKIGAYIEYVGVTGSSNFDYQATFSAGLTYGISGDVQFDVGGRVGLNDAANDGGVFTGITIRF